MRAFLPLILAAVLAAPGGAAAAPAETPPPQGRVFFVKDGALWEIDVSGGSPVRRAHLLPDATPGGVQASPGGKVVLVTYPRASVWISGGELVQRDCTGPGRLSPRGECVACPSGETWALFHTRKNLSKKLPARFEEVAFFGPQLDELAALTDGGVTAFRIRNPRQQRPLAHRGPRSHLMPAPSGQRAVAIFGEGVDSRVKAFALDGKGVPRVLGGPGVPLAWSPDSQWVLLQVGEIPEEEDDNGEGDEDDDEPAPTRRRRGATAACAQRAIGGESMCWTNYDGVGFSPDSQHVLLWRGGSLYVAPVHGVKPPPPRKLTEADGPAVWVR